MSLKTGSVKPKVTYRVGRKLRPTAHPARGGRWASPGLASDVHKLQDEGLAEIVERWGMLFARRHAEADAQSIRKTLRVLAAETDANAVAALRLVDEGTLCALRGAAFRDAKRRGEKFSLTSWRTWTAEQIREYAADARLRLRAPAGGRTRVQELRVLFARELIGYWIRSTGKPAAVTKPSETADASPFLDWATKAFMAAGVVITPQSLAPILSRAKRG